ncbi:hypothetical protein TUM20985_06070 [Mycobacterium antarcticum]|nr:hypothetical protein TUM20985_06070 [Mycolicibacterium sp. TUM20985]GLP79195.1 hypothetical protein TUM20984_06150 [Mycolicibacterium sp. TUM20984]
MLDAVPVGIAELVDEVATNRVVTMTGPAEQGGERERGGQDEEGKYHVHGSNCVSANIPPTVAVQTWCVKMLP